MCIHIHIPLLFFYYLYAVVLAGVCMCICVCDECLLVCLCVLKCMSLCVCVCMHACVCVQHACTEVRRGCCVSFSITFHLILPCQSLSLNLEPGCWPVSAASLLCLSPPPHHQRQTHIAMVGFLTWVLGI